MTAETHGRSDRRRRRDRRAGEDRRKSWGRRSSDTVGRFAIVPALWALVGALVVVYLFFAALGQVSYHDAPAATIAALALGVLWLIHAWRRVFIGSRSPVSDRERRGF